MSKLDEAEMRLRRAVTELEHVVRTRSGNAGASSSDTAEAAITAAGAKAGELQALNASVVERLDIAIQRVKNILGN